MKTPETIYLQWFGDYDPDMLSESERDAIEPSGASWQSGIWKHCAQRD